MPSNGRVTVDSATGVTTYLPDLGFIGIDQFDYTVEDNEGRQSTASTTTVFVSSVLLGTSDINTNGYQLMVGQRRLDDAITNTPTAYVLRGVHWGEPVLGEDLARITDLANTVTIHVDRELAARELQNAIHELTVILDLLYVEGVMAVLKINDNDQIENDAA